MTYIRQNSDGSSNSFNFIPPAGAEDQLNEVLFPIGDKQSPDYAATLAVDVKQMETFLQPGALTGNVTINLTIDSQVTKGAKLHLKVKESANSADRTVTLGDGFDADATDITVVKATTVCKTFVYDGSAFVPCNQ